MLKDYHYCQTDNFDNIPIGITSQGLNKQSRIWQISALIYTTLRKTQMELLRLESQSKHLEATCCGNLLESFQWHFDAQQITSASVINNKLKINKPKILLYCSAYFNNSKAFSSNLWPLETENNIKVDNSYKKQIMLYF